MVLREHRGGRWRLGAVGVVAVVALAAAACSSSSSSSGAKVTHSGGTLRLAVVGLDSLDPATVVPTNLADMVAVSLLDDGLTVIDPTHNQAAPALATKWTSNAPAGKATSGTTGTTTTPGTAGSSGPEAAPVGTTWTFTLDAHARFADGSAVTPADVVAALTAVAAKGNATLAGARLDVIKGYNELVAGKTKELSGLVAGDGVVRITTNAPDAELPLTLASPVYTVTKSGHEAESPSPTAPSGTATTVGPRLEAPVGAGSFKVLSDDGITLRLVRSPGSVAELDEVDLVREATSTAALAAVHDGDADWASVPPADRASATGGHVGYTLQSPLGAEEFFGINLASPTFANPLFRRAIIVATNRNTVVASALPGLEVNAGVVPIAVPGSVDDPCGAACDYSTDTAKALLAQAFPTGQIPTVEIDTDDDPGDVALANAVGAQLTAVGIPVKVTPQPFATYQSFITTGRQQLFRTGWVGLWPSAGAYLSPLFRSTSLDNSTAYSSAVADKALAVAAATADATQRQIDYQAAQKIIMSDYAVLPLASFTQVLALSTRVHDYSPRLDGTFNVDRVQVKGTTGTSG